MLSIIIKEIKAFFRNPSTVFFSIFFPTLLVFVLGTFLQNLDNAENKVGEISVVFYTNSQDMNSQAMESFLDSLVDEGTIKCEKSTDLTAALAKLKSGDTDEVISLDNGEVTLHIGTDDIKNSTTKLILQSYNRVSQVYVAVANQNPTALSTIDMSQEKSSTTAKDLGVNRTMLDYYAVAMIIMALFMCNLIDVGNALREEETFTTSLRLYISPVSPVKLYIGRIIGSLSSSTVQIISTMLVSVLFFDCHYCKDLKGNIVLFVMFVFASLALSSIGLVIAQLIKAPPNAVIMPAVWVMLFFSGVYSKEIYVEGFTEKMPPYMMLNAAFDLTIFGRYSGAIWTIIISVVALLAFTALGTFIYCKKGGVKR